MLNKVILIGRPTKDVEVSYTKDNKQVTRLTLAVRDPMSKDKTDFIPCVAFGKTGEIISKGVKKGDRISFEGFISVSNYQAKDGTTRTSFNVVINEVVFLEKKKTSESEVVSEDAVDTVDIEKSCDLTVDDIDDKDLPF